MNRCTVILIVFVAVLGILFAIYNIANRLLFAGASLPWPSRWPTGNKESEATWPAERRHPEDNSISKHISLTVEHQNFCYSQAELHLYYRGPLNVSGIPVALVLFSHGNAGDIKTTWRLVVDFMYEFLCQQRPDVCWTVVTYDYRSFGRSKSIRFPTEDLTLADATTIHNYVTKELLQKAKSVHLCLYGRSLGAAVSVHLGAGLPDVRGVFLETPFLGSHSLHIPNIRSFPAFFDCSDALRKLRVKVHSVNVLHDLIIDCEAATNILQEAGHGGETMHILNSRREGHNTVYGSPVWTQVFKTFIDSCFPHNIQRMRIA
jgi:pimeloyl-ACP methyl ester carboxylesterase